MDKLIDAGGMPDTQHLPRNLVGVPGGNLEPRLLVLQERFYIFYFRQFEKGVQPAFGTEEDVERPDLFAAGGHKIRGIAFKNVRQVDAKPVDIPTAKGVHVVLGDKRPLALLYPRKLDFLMPVKMRIEIRQDIFLDDNRFITRYRDRKLQYFHPGEITAFANISNK